MNMEDMLIQMAVTVVLQSVKNPAKKQQLKKALAKVYNVIGNTYAGDAEFNTLVGRP